MQEAIAEALRAEFSDLAGVREWTRLAVRLGLAIVLGAAIGWEREQKGSTAGLRTHMLVSFGCALFVLVPQQAGMQIADLSRVIQGIVAGIGFLGIGTIVKTGSETGVRGLTTAAGIWTTAAIGVTVGVGHEATAIVATVAVIAILSLLLRIEKRFGSDGGAPPGEARGRPASDGESKGEQVESTERAGR
jgi:putative Mg2+ transporter-C (MgtC) family protein